MGIFKPADIREVTEEAIKDFFESNFLKNRYQSYNIYQETSGKYIIDVHGDLVVTNRELESLTNGLFEFRTVVGSFICNYCEKLKSLEGGPIDVYEFSAYQCHSLKNLIGAPATVRGGFIVKYCNNLESLEGSPEIVKGTFDCEICNKLKDLTGAPKTVRNFDCSHCINLTSLKGIPYVKNIINCSGCKKLEDVNIPITFRKINLSGCLNIPEKCICDFYHMGILV